MEQELQSTAKEQDRTSDGSHGMRIILGAVLGYVAGRTLLKKPFVGAILGAALAFVLGSSDGGEEG